MFYKTWWITDNSAIAIATNYYEETKKRPPPVTAEGAKSRPPRVLSFNTYTHTRVTENKQNEGSYNSRTI